VTGILRPARALAWLRWRMFLNAFRKTHRRDTLERISRAGSAILPIVFAVTLVPAFLVTCGLSLMGGWYVGRASTSPRSCSPCGSRSRWRPS
jgi:hypothetical protein